MHTGTKRHTDWDLKCFIFAATLNSKVDRAWDLVSNSKCSHTYQNAEFPKPVGCKETSISKILESVFHAWDLYQIRKRLLKGAFKIFNKRFSMCLGKFQYGQRKRIAFLLNYLNGHAVGCND